MRVWERGPFLSKGLVRAGWSTANSSRKPHSEATTLVAYSWGPGPAVVYRPFVPRALAAGVGTQVMQLHASITESPSAALWFHGTKADNRCGCQLDCQVVQLLAWIAKSSVRFPVTAR